MNDKSLIDKDGEVRELIPEDYSKFEPLSEANPLLLVKIKHGVGERAKRLARAY